MKKNYIINKKCPFCGIILDGYMVETDKQTGELRTEIIENTCSCSREKVLEKVKDKCCVCGKVIGNIREESEQHRINRFEIFGNWCRKCNAKVIKGTKKLI